MTIRPLPRADVPPITVPDCHDGVGAVCITCSDTAVEVTVARLLDDDMALVRTSAGTEEEVSVGLVDADVGAVLLVHAGEAIAVLGGDRA